jgi:hypothetical protein
MALDAIPPKRRRNVARPLEELSPAYRRRIERQLAKGKSRQEARGHKIKEHVQRREREIKSAQTIGTFTSGQRSQVRAYIRQQIKRTPERELPQPAPSLAEKFPTGDRALVDTVLQLFERVGWVVFVEKRRVQNSLHREYAAAGSPKRLRYEAPEFADDFADDLDDQAWLMYYH